MAKRSRKPERSTSSPSIQGDADAVVGLRIIGGTLRGRKLLYSGDPRTRPMKDRLREAIFNLIGPEIKGKHVFDLFAGTGALALEAISRGAARATLLEQHFPTAKIIGQNIAALGVEHQAEVLPGNVFIWWKKTQRDSSPALHALPWTVFCSPPYEFFVSRSEEMLELIAGLCESAPPGSIVVVESDERFDVQTLPNASAWNVRHYPPAVVGLYWKEC